MRFAAVRSGISTTLGVTVAEKYSFAIRIDFSTTR